MNNTLRVSQDDIIIRLRKTDEIDEVKTEIIKRLKDSTNILAIKVDYIPTAQYYGIEIYYESDNGLPTLLMALIDTDEIDAIKEINKLL